MKRILLPYLLAMASLPLAAQQLNGQLTHHKGQQLTLIGFNYYNTYELGTTSTDSLGKFTLSYQGSYTGMAMLEAKNKMRTVLILTKEGASLTGTSLADSDSLYYKPHSLNQQFLEIARGNAFNDQAYAGFRYLQNIYANSYFKAQQSTLTTINKEIQRIEESDLLARYQVAKESYLYWYAPLRKLVSDMPQTINRYAERRDKHINDFRATDFNHPYFKTSGLFRELIEGHYFLLENGGSLDNVYAQMNKSTDYLLQNLQQNDTLLNAVSKELFRLFEKRSLFKAAAHLSERLLQSIDCDCRIAEDLQKKMQKYVTLKVGNTAPDILLTPTKKLSDLGKNILLIFGSSTCPHCTKELPLLQRYNAKWRKEKNLEIVYISLDMNQGQYQKMYGGMPWSSYFDGKGWDGPAAKDYYVNATPSYILLDKDLKILLHPKSAAHVNAWIYQQL